MSDLTGFNTEKNASLAFGHCLLLAVSYVGSLYIIKSPLPRDHPKTIKQRIVAVTIVCIFGPIYVYYCGDFSYYSNRESFSFSKLLGLHLENISKAFIYPLLLTMILFFGPITLELVTNGISNTLSDIFRWSNFSDLKWYRQYVAAPLSEEFIFRACMLPVLIPHFGIFKSIFMAPLLFGVAHLHHIIEGFRNGQKLIPVLLTSLFQLMYTTIFGAYSAFLFVRTGHLIGPIICHCFCNMMGFPDFEGISLSDYPKLIAISFLVGLVLFIMFLFPLTDPAFFNSFYWK